MPQTLGVLALQGDFEKHIHAFNSLQQPDLQIQQIRTPQDLEQCDRLVIPGGESTTVGLLLQRFGLGDAIQQKVKEGMPIWGTCMGMIIMAKEVEGREQFTLNLLDITVRRNAFGAQIHSFEDEVNFEALDEPVTGVFIRAPIVTRTGKDVKILSTYQEKIVAVQQGSRLGTSFHPELTDDTSIHRYFMKL